jgi:hypothetical protein
MDVQLAGPMLFALQQGSYADLPQLAFSSSMSPHCEPGLFENSTIN